MYTCNVHCRWICICDLINITKENVWNYIACWSNDYLNRYMYISRGKMFVDYTSTIILWHVTFSWMGPKVNFALSHIEILKYYRILLYFNTFGPTWWHEWFRLVQLKLWFSCYLCITVNPCKQRKCPLETYPLYHILIKHIHVFDINICRVEYKWSVKRKQKKKQSTLSFNMNEEEERNSKSECEWYTCMFITCDISTKSHDIAHYFSGKSHCCSDKVQYHMISHMMWLW